MTDPDTISRIGHQLGARYVVAGSINSLGSQRLLVISIIQLEKLQQIAGDWQAYGDLGEI
jgi:TolB-like protein